MRDFREPASKPSAYMRGPERVAGHLLQGHSQGRPQRQLFCLPCAPASFVSFLRESQQPQRGVSCSAVGCDLRRCEPVRAHSQPSKLQPQFLHEGGRVAYVAVLRGGGRPLLHAVNRVVKFALSTSHNEAAELAQACGQIKRMPHACWERRKQRAACRGTAW